MNTTKELSSPLESKIISAYLCFNDIVLSKVRSNLNTKNVRALRGLTKSFKNILLHNGVRKLDK
jgi:hypothetical protein